MSTTYRARHRWDERSYRRIIRAEYDEDRGEVSVEFADGSTVVFDPTPLVPPDLVEPDWWRIGANQIEVLVPHANGWFEIPWDVVRRHTDPEYAAHWDDAWYADGTPSETPLRMVREEPHGSA